jgi:pimeloyl-ACP methyl ester carboxylesterase
MMDFMDVTRSTLKIGRYNLFYTRAGTGPPVILLHGLAGSSRWWAKNIPELARHFEVYTLDLAGFGRSRGQSFVLQEAASMVLEWMDRLGLDHSHLIAHSMGGYIATHLVAQNPDRVNRFVLVDAVVLPLRSSLPAVTLRLLHAIRYMSFDFLPVLFADTLTAGPVTLYRAIRDILQADLTSEMERIQSDLMIMWGEHDTLLPVAMGYEMHRQLPAARFTVIKGAGHNPMWDRPQVFNEAVIDFLLAGEKTELEKDRNPVGFR